MQPLAQEIAKAQITGAEKVEIAFCPCAALAFCAWASKKRQFQRKEMWINRHLFWSCATNFIFQHVLWQTYRLFFFMGEDFSSSRIKTKCSIIREIELKNILRFFWKIFQYYTTIWWTSGLSHCHWKNLSAVSNVFHVLQKKTQNLEESRREEVDF